MAHLNLTLAAGVLTVALSSLPPALAQGDDVGGDIWEYFADTCPAIVAAPNPIGYAVGVDWADVAVGSTFDDRITTALLSVHEPPVPAVQSGMYVQVHEFGGPREFGGGSTVYCDLTVFAPRGTVHGLEDLDSATVAAALGVDSIVASGGTIMTQARLGDGAPDVGIYMRRFSTPEYPPRVLLIVQMAERRIGLLLRILEPRE